MHGKNKLKKLKADFDEANSSMSASDFFQSAVLPGASNELHRKAMGIRAYKAYCWLCSPTTLMKLMVTTGSIGPLERVMFTFMKWQRECVHVQNGPSPIAIMSTTFSPAREAIGELCCLMTEGRIAAISTPSLCLQDFVDGHMMTFTGNYLLFVLIIFCASILVV